MPERYPNHTNRRLTITGSVLALLIAVAAMTGCADNGEPEGVAGGGSTTPPGTFVTTPAPPTTAPGTTAAPATTAAPVTTITPTTEPNPVLTIPQADSALAPGTYLISKQGRGGSDPIVWSIVDYTITFPAGLIGHTGHYVSKNEDVEGASGYGFYPVLVDEVYADPCLGESGPTVTVGPAPDDLVDALVAQPGTTTTVTHTTIGGYPATRVDLEIADDVDLESCFLFDFGPPGGLQIWFSAARGKYFVSMPDLVSTVYVVDTNGKRQVFMAAPPSDASDEDVAELQAIVDSIHIL